MPFLWLNEKAVNPAADLANLPLSLSQMEEAHERWQRLAPVIEGCFPECPGKQQCRSVKCIPSLTSFNCAIKRRHAKLCVPKSALLFSPKVIADYVLKLPSAILGVIPHLVIVVCEILLCAVCIVAHFVVCRSSRSPAIEGTR